MTEMNGHCNRHGLNQHGMLHLLQVFLHSPIPSVMLVVLVNPESCQEGTSQCRHFSLCYYLTCLEIQGDKCVRYRTIILL